MDIATHIPTHIAQAAAFNGDQSRGMRTVNQTVVLVPSLAERCAP